MTELKEKYGTAIEEFLDSMKKVSIPELLELLAYFIVSNLIMLTIAELILKKWDGIILSTIKTVIAQMGKCIEFVYNTPAEALGLPNLNAIQIVCAILLIRICQKRK